MCIKRISYRGIYNIYYTDLIRALANNDVETINDIEWWLYEDVEKEWTIDGELVKVETPEQFYDALKKLNRV